MCAHVGAVGDGKNEEDEKKGGAGREEAVGKANQSHFVVKCFMEGRSICGNGAAVGGRVGGCWTGCRGGSACYYLHPFISPSTKLDHLTFKYDY